MADTGTPPVIPIEFQRYNSYVEDPKWQRKFSTIWPAVAGLFVLLALPHLVRSVRSGRAFASVWGVTEEFGHAGYEAVGASKRRPTRRRGGRGSALRRVEATLSRMGAWLYWTLPGIGLNLGQIIIVAAYLLTVVLCIVLKAPLISNSNRAGFLALAQLTPIFLLATKNSILSLLLGPGRGYEKLNFLHRWAGRALFVSALVHGALWIRNHVEYGIEIMGEQKEESGIAAFACLGIIVLSSLRVVRRWAWGLFFAVHVLVFPAFFITVCYHTIYARPWIYPALALYGLDLLLRMLKIRIKDAVLVPIGKQMTLVHIPYATSGWLAGQHVRLRVFFSGRVFEAHPLTIFAAPPSTTCISPSSYPQGISLGARVSGDWTRALNAYAREAANEILADENNSQTISAGALEKKHHPNLRVEVPVQVMIDGPYGGSSVDLGQYDSVLLFAGGAGVTFTLGLLDDIVGRVARRRREGGERTRRVEFGWCVRSFGSIDWFAPALHDIATLAASSLSSASPDCPGIEVHISIYVTCLCNPEAVPPIPNLDVTIVRPDVWRVLADLAGFVSGLPSAPSTTSLPVRKADKEKATSVAGPSETVRRGETKAVEMDIIAATASSASSVEEIELDPTEDPLAYPLPSTRFSLSPDEDEEGSIAVCAAGPASMTREAANAVARLQMHGTRRLGKVGLHTEVFSL